MEGKRRRPTQAWLESNSINTKMCRREGGRWWLIQAGLRLQSSNYLHSKGEQDTRVTAACVPQTNFPDNERAEEQGDNEPTRPEESASEDRNGICTLEHPQSCKP